MQHIYVTLMIFLVTFSSNSQQGENRFVYELSFEFNSNASISEAEKQFFIFYEGFKRSQYCTQAVAHQHHSGDRLDYKILAYTDSWDKIDDMLEEAQNYFAEQDPTMFTDPWKIIHTGDAIYAVRKSAEEGYITK